MIFIYLAIFMVYCMPGLYLARSMYSEQIRTIRNTPVQIAPKKPARPEIKLNEMLHEGGIRKCYLVDTVKNKGISGGACTCSSRKDWVELKNAWIDYNEWVERYGNRPTVEKEPKPKSLVIYGSVPVWPLVMAGQFIKGGAKNIPDYRLIERMEEINGITDPLKELN